MKIGILSGSFDPVHTGHIALALAAKQAAGLDIVYLCPEAVPRRKTGVTHIAHRVAMLRLAIRPHQGLELLEFPDKNFSVVQTLPRLDKYFPGADLYYICGMDMLEHMPKWHLVDRFFNKMTLIVGDRHDVSSHDNIKQIESLGARVVRVKLPPNAQISSSKLRDSIYRHKHTKGFLKSIRRYVKNHWLYVGVTSDSLNS